MKKIKFLFAFAFVAAAMNSCLEVEPLDIQDLYTYDEQYYENIREFKKGDHILSYCYYAAWAPLEGSVGYKDPASWGERLRGLPDSLDICNLWMGYPSPDPKNENYSPVAYADMKYMQKTLGTRFVLHGDAATTREVVYKDETLNIHDLYNAWKGGSGSEEDFRKALNNHAQIMIDKVNDAGLDGVDVDWEPNLAVWRDPQTLIDLMTILRDKLPGKLIIVDTFSDVPPAELEPIIDYLVVQRYSPQVGRSVTQLDNGLNAFALNVGIPKEKFIACEQGGETAYALNGGGEWLDASGNKMLRPDGSQMYSYEGFARWAAKKKVGGWGVFYVDRNYYSASGIPYREFRRAIQCANPIIY